MPIESSLSCTHSGAVWFQSVAQFAERGEVAGGDVWAAFQRRHRHQTANRTRADNSARPPAAVRRRPARGRAWRLRPMCSLPIIRCTGGRVVTAVSPAASLIAASRRSLSTLWISETSGSVRRTLLRCRWPMRCQRTWDRGPTDRPGSLEVVGFFPQFLRAAFAEVVAAGGDEFGRLRAADVFRHADERDFVGTPAGAIRARRLSDACSRTRCEDFGDGHRCHSILHRFDLDPLLEFAVERKRPAENSPAIFWPEHRAIAGGGRASDRTATGRGPIGRGSRRRRRAARFPSIRRR